MMTSDVVYHSGFVSIVGRPNVGKSTLINRLLNQKIAAVSPRPQTTRRRQLGILTLENAQIVFVDTPGLHVAKHHLGEFMNQEAAAALQEMDAVLWLVDATEAPTDEDRLVAERLGRLNPQPPIFLLLNKTDIVKQDVLLQRQEAFLALLPQARPLAISAASGLGCAGLLQTMLELLPEGEAFYDEDQITDQYEREIAADLIREAALLHLRDEVPHCTAVRIDEYEEHGESGAHIRATIFAERDSHKGILIGKGGDMIKRIGTAARKSIEEMSGRKVFLELNVKVNKNWRDNPEALRLFGYYREEE